jgi:hypothetical protein
MNTKRLLDKVLDKWPAKVVCLIIAIFLYFFHQASLIESKTFVVPLQIIENGIVMHIGNAPKSISVVVRAEEEAIKSVLATDLTATVCLDDITKKGIYKLPVKITLADSLLEYDPFEVKIKDDTVTIEVDRKAIKYVPLIPSVIGEVASGYEIDTIIMNPSTIEIIGPESVLNATEQIYTTRVNVSNAENNFSTETSYQQLNKLLTVVDEGPFKAEVSLKPKIIEKEYAVVGFSDGNEVVIPGVIEIAAMAKGSDKGVALQGKVVPRSSYENLLKKFEAFVRKIGFVGLFDIDFYRSEGLYFFGELNLRIGGSGFAIIKSGINLPEMLVRNLMGKSLEGMKKEITTQSTYTNERICIENWYAGFLTHREFFSIFRCRGISALSCKQDRHPEFIFWMKAIKKLFLPRKKGIESYIEKKSNR